MKLFKSNKLSTMLYYVEGMDVFDKSESINVIWNKDKNVLEFKSVTNKKKQNVKLSVDKILSADTATEREITEKDKTVIGRAAVGTLLAGPLGTVIGGISGRGTKKKKGKEEKVAVIEHEGGKIVLLSGKLSIGMDQLFKGLNKRVTEGAEETIEL